MPVLHIEHRVNDLDMWLRDYASRAPVREQVGVTEVRLLQADDDPLYIVELIFFDAAEAANNYVTFLREHVWTSSRPGLSSNPSGRILHELEPGA